MRELPVIDEPAGASRSRGVRLVLEIVAWVLAFSLLLCVPSERSTGAYPAERARTADTR